MTIAYSYLRLSTKVQLKGDGQRRQHEETVKAAKEHGWELSEQTFKDLGVSAFKGANVTIGAFGAFLELVRDGSIARGSVLIVENPDRISREHLNDSVDLMRSLLRSGISIYTLSPQRLFTPDDDQTTSFTNLLIWSIEAMRAHSESAEKSRRVREQKEAVREKARRGEKTLVGMYPPWLKRVYTGDDKTDWELVPIPERVEVVKLCYELRLKGYGVRTIVKELEERGFKPFRESTKNWSDYLIRRWLTVPNVIGTYQPQKRVDGKKVDAGDPIEGFYPAIIDRETFNKVQSTFTKKKTQGRHTTNHRNIFRGLLRCACGGTWVYRAYSVGKYKYVDLRCGNHGTPYCSRPKLNYERFEQMVLQGLTVVDWEGVFYKSQGLAAETLKGLKEAYGKAKDEALAVERELDQLETILADLKDSKRLKRKYSELESKLDHLETEEEALKLQIQQLESEALSSVNKGGDFMSGLMEFVNSGKNDPDKCMEVGQRLLRELSAIEIDVVKGSQVQIRIDNHQGVRLLGIDVDKQLTLGNIVEGGDGSLTQLYVYLRDGRRTNRIGGHSKG